MQPCRFNLTSLWDSAAVAEWTCASRYTCFLTVENLLGYERVRPLEILASPLDRTDICVFYWLYLEIRDTAVIAKGICLHRATFLGPLTFSGRALAKANFVFCPLLPSTQPVHDALWLHQARLPKRVDCCEVKIIAGQHSFQFTH